MTVLVVAALTGCAASGPASIPISHALQSQWASPLALDPVAPQQRIAVLEISQAADLPVVSIQPVLAQALTGKGWRLVDRPGDAQYRIQVTILNAGKTTPMQARVQLAQGYGAPLIAFGEQPAGAAGYGVLADVQVFRSSGVTIRMDGQQIRGASNPAYSEDIVWQRYRSRLLTLVTPVDQPWEQARPDLERGLAAAIANVF